MAVGEGMQLVRSGFLVIRSAGEIAQRRVHRWRQTSLGDHGSGGVWKRCQTRTRLDLPGAHGDARRLGLAACVSGALPHTHWKLFRADVRSWHAAFQNLLREKICRGRDSEGDASQLYFCCQSHSEALPS
jgi:hypothetical protein